MKTVLYILVALVGLWVMYMYGATQQHQALQEVDMYNSERLASKVIAMKKENFPNYFTEWQDFTEEEFRRTAQLLYDTNPHLPPAADSCSSHPCCKERRGALRFVQNLLLVRV